MGTAARNVMDMNEGEDGVMRRPRVNRTRSLVDIARDVTRMVETGERVLDEISAIVRAEGGQPARAPRQPKPATPPGPPPSIQNFHFEGTKKGGAVASFDGKRVDLPPALAELVAILISDGDGSRDEFHAWKSFDLMGQRLEERFRRKFKHHNVSQILWRLRKAFRRADLDTRVIEISPQLGVRLRLKRSATAHCAQ